MLYTREQNTETKTSDNKSEPYEGATKIQNQRQQITKVNHVTNKGAKNTESKTSDNKSEPCDIQGSTKYRIKDIR